jgi:hypothetical protein
VNHDLVNCLNKNFEIGSLSNSQKQIIVTSLEKQGKDNRLLDSWRPISLINVDTKICSRALSNRLNNILPLVHHDQAAFIKNRRIEDPLTTIQDIMDYVKAKNKSLLIFAADFEKAFDSIEHNFILAVMRHFGFGDNIVKWLKILLTNNLSCIMNNGHATNFFQLNSIKLRYETR